MKPIKAFLYDIKSRKKEEMMISVIRNKREIEQSSNTLLIITEKKDALRKIIEAAKRKKKRIIVRGFSDEINRLALERGCALLSPEFSRRKDFMHYRNSGLNHVLCKIAKEKKTFIATDYSEIKLKFLKNKKEAALHISRVMQNYRLCKKYGVPFKILDFSLSQEKEIRNFAKEIIK